MKSHLLLNLALLLFLISCSAKENPIIEEQQKKLNKEELKNVSSIVISSDVNSLKTGGLVEFTSNVTLENGTTKNITSNTIFFVNNSRIVGNKYIATKSGVIKVRAEYSTKQNTIKSKELSLKVDEIALPTSFTKKVVVEDYTATWCGICPRVSYALELVNKKTDKVFSVGIHFKDDFANKFSNELVKINDVQGFPTVYVNRNFMWEIPQEDNPEFVINKADGNVKLGLSVSSALSENKMQIAIGTGIAQSEEELKLVVFILEDGVVGQQSNYTSYYGGTGTIKEFVHNHILRHSVTHVLGNPIENAKGLQYKTFNVDLNSGIYISKTKNLGILAMLVSKIGGKVLNAQYAKVNTFKNFD